MMYDLLLGLIILPIFIGVGALVERALRRYEKASASLMWNVSVWMLIGGGVTTLFQAILSVFGVPLSYSLMIAGVGACAGFWKQRLSFVVRKPVLSYAWFWIVTFAFCTVLFTRSFSRVMYTWDSIAFWVPKMVALSESQKVSKPTLEPFNHPEYPLLLPLSGADVMMLAKEPNEIAAKVVFFGYSLAFVGLLGVFLLKHHNQWKALFWMFMLLSAFIVREHVAGEYAGTADILVGTFMAAGAIVSLSGQPIVGLLLWMMLPWAKSEGLVFTLAVSGFLFLWNKPLRPWIVGFGLMLVGPWRVIVKWMGVDSSQYFKLNEIYARPWAAYATYSVHAFREEFRNIQKWNFIFYVFLAQTIRSFSAIWKDKWVLTIYLGLLAQIVMYIVICTITPEEQASFIAAAISRLSLHLAPTAVVMASYLHAKKHQST